jgi:glutamate--cysteine ligase
MSVPSQQDNTPIENKSQLICHMDGGCKQKHGLLIGTEHEKFTLNAADFSLAKYEGDKGVQALLQGMTRFGYEPVFEGKTLVALQRGREGITLEPAGQFELSGAPLTNLHDTADELQKHFHEVKEVAGELGLTFVPIGYHPTAKVEDMPWMPKGRYSIMRNYMPKVGTRGLEMMTLTCTTQVNLDYCNEADMVRKFRVSLALSPVVSAIFANSPFMHGHANGMASNRCAVWLDVDNNRAGIPKMVFEDGFSYERYVDYALDVPMYFVLRDGKYIDCAGQSFRDFMAGKLPALPGEKPRMTDWMDHLTTIFTDVRAKTYLEMRTADVGNPAMIMALPTLWVGLLYCDSTLSHMEALVKEWSYADIVQLRHDVPKLGLNATIKGKKLLDIARQLVHHATLGLRRRAVRKGGGGPDETRYLEPITAILDSEETQSEALVRLLETDWPSINTVFEELQL